MGKPSKSQWDFGELFPPESRGAERPGGGDAPQPAGEQARKVLSVSELTAQVRRLLEQQVGQVWVTGEATNLRVQGSGHIYFTLKDATSQLSCVLFRGEKAAHRELLQDGRKLLLQGDVTVYEARGQYQLIVRAVELLNDKIRLRDMIALHQRAQAFKFLTRAFRVIVLGVMLGINGNDVTATTIHKRLNAKVVIVAAIGDIQPMRLWRIRHGCRLTGGEVDNLPAQAMPGNFIAQARNVNCDGGTGDGDGIADANGYIVSKHIFGVQITE